MSEVPEPHMSPNSFGSEFDPLGLWLVVGLILVLLVVVLFVLYKVHRFESKGERKPRERDVEKERWDEV